MKATVVLPIKRFGAAKQRLGERLDEPERAGLAMASFADSLEAICMANLVERVVVVTGDRKAERHALWRARRVEIPIEVLQDPEDAGHNPAAAIGVEWARAQGAQAVALLPGDCPLLDPAELDEALSLLGPDQVLVVPDRHGAGTNGLLLSPANAISPAFGPGSCERHIEKAERRGLAARRCEISSLALDLDTPDDLQALADTLAERPAAGEGRTAQTLSRLGVRRQ